MRCASPCGNGCPARHSGRCLKGEVLSWSLKAVPGPSGLGGSTCAVQTVAAFSFVLLAMIDHLTVKVNYFKIDLSLAN